MTAAETPSARFDHLTPARLRLWAIIPAVLFTLFLARDIAAHAPPGLVDARGEAIGRDFINVWAAPRLAASGGGGDVYVATDLTAFERAHVASGVEPRFYPYPPVALLLGEPFSVLPMAPEFVLWLLSGGLLCAWLLSDRLGWTGATIAVLALPAAALNAYNGQTGAFSAALLAGGVLVLDRRPGLAGALFALIAFKPQLGLLIPVALIAGGYWRATAAAALAGGILAGATILVFGWAPWAAFLNTAAAQHTLMEGHPHWWPRMPTVLSAAMTLRLPAAVAYGAQILSAAAAAAVTAVVWRSGASTQLKGAILFVATFVTTPYAWDYDTVILLFAAVWGWDAAAPSRSTLTDRAALGAMIAAPLFAPLLAAAWRCPVEPLVLWTAILTLARHALPNAPSADSKP